MIWPFRKRKRAPEVIDRRCMNEDWQVGDLAECIDDDFYPIDSFDPKTGDVLRVTAVKDAMNGLHLRFFALKFEGKPQDWSWECTAFRKLRPIQVPSEQTFSAWLRDALRQRDTVPEQTPTKEPVH